MNLGNSVAEKDGKDGKKPGGMFEAYFRFALVIL